MTQLSEHIQVYGEATPTAALTHGGGVIGALSLSGVEPALLSDNDKIQLTKTLRNIFQRLPFEATLSQYYFHNDSQPIAFKSRSHPRANLVSTRRARFLNSQRKLYQSRLIWVVEMTGATNYAKPGMDWVVLCLQSLVDKSQRHKLKQALSYRHATLLEHQELNEQISELDDLLDSMDLGLSFSSTDNTRLSVGQIYGLQKALLTLCPDSLYECRDAAPPQDWDVLLSESNVDPVVIDGTHYLKITGSETRYARIASIKGVGVESVPAAAWGNHHCPVLKKGNYLVFTRFVPLDAKGKRNMVNDKDNDLIKSQTKILDLMKGDFNAETIHRRMESDPQLKARLAQLKAIENDDDHYGHWVSYVVVFDSHIDKLKLTFKALKNALENSQFHLLWESVGLLGAYETMQLGYRKAPIRSAYINTSKQAALSLLYRSHEGVPSWRFGQENEEALYVFESDDGVPFHYTPFVGEKCLVIGIGPTRSGKTFLKLCVALHFLKLGGMYAAMDVDKGSEALARFFQEDASVFRLTNSGNSGFNPFSLCQGADDHAFAHHMMHLIELMLSTNQARELTTLTANEQAQLESAISHVMSQTKAHLRTFSSMLGKCSPSLKDKLKNFSRGGQYGHFFDNDVDAIGQVDKPYSVYNTEAIKDVNDVLAQLVNNEIFFRLVRLFEDPKHRTRAKFLEVDEAQYVLSKKGAAEFLVAKARTWFKHGGGMGFWSQSPKHFSQLDEWSTLCSSASTFIFMSDPKLTRQEYLDAFPFLTEQELNTIEGLIPKRQALIKQPDIGLSKVVNLIVEPEQYAVATSKADEADLAERIFAKEPNVDVAIDQIIEALNLT